MNVVVIYGGKSGEHEISLLSCANIIRGISEKHSVTLISISKEGKWYLEEKNVFDEIRQDTNAHLAVHKNPGNEVSLAFGRGKNEVFFAKGNFISCDIVLPILHGTYGEDGSIQGLFEMAGVPYAGCTPLSSATCMDKETAKVLFASAGIPIVPYKVLTRSQINDSSLYDSLIEEVIKDLGFPLFVKPCSAGSSDGANKAIDRRQLSFSLMEAFTWDNKVLIEKAIDAREVECSVMGNSVTATSETPCTMLQAFGPGEIIPAHDFYDYDAKYTDPNGATLKIPADLSEERLENIRTLAKKAYTAVNASGLSRVDFFIDRKTDELYLNEINTMPGFTSISMFPKMCEASGISLSALIDLILEEGRENFKAKQNLCTSR